MTISKFLMYVIVIMFLIFLGTVAWLAFVLVKKMPKKLPTIALITSFVLTIILSGALTFQWKNYHGVMIDSSDLNVYKKTEKNTNAIAEAYLNPTESTTMAASNALKNQKKIMNKLPDSSKKRRALSADNKLIKSINSSFSADYTNDLDSWADEEMSDDSSISSYVANLSEPIRQDIKKRNDLSADDMSKVTRHVMSKTKIAKLVVAEYDSESSAVLAEYNSDLESILNGTYSDDDYSY